MKAAIVNRLGQFAIVIWALGMIIVVACLMVSHWIVLPHPTATDQAWTSQLNQSRSRKADQWTVFHFLYGDCPCSRQILKHILNRAPVEGCLERIVFIGEDPQSIDAALQKGFEVNCVTPEILKMRYGVDAAPLLTIVDPTGAVRFAGGYTTHKQGPQIQDVKIIQALLKGDFVEGLPLFGCAVSDELKSLVDPLGLKK